MRQLICLFVTVAACDYLPCPQDVRLTEADVPCTCAGAIVESVDCGDLTCGEFGIEIETDASTEDCVTTSTYSTSSTTPLR